MGGPLRRRCEPSQSGSKVRCGPRPGAGLAALCRPPGSAEAAEMYALTGPPAGSAVPGRGIPGMLQVSRVGAGHRIQRGGRIAGLLKVLERLPAHGSVDMQVGNADDGAELLEHEEARPVVNHSAPVQTAYEP